MLEIISYHLWIKMIKINKINKTSTNRMNNNKLFKLTVKCTEKSNKLNI